MSRLTRDGTAEPVSRDQILRHARGQGNIHFPCSADHEQGWQPYPVDPYFAICDDHTYIHTLTFRPPSERRSAETRRSPRWRPSSAAGSRRTQKRLQQEKAGHGVGGRGCVKTITTTRRKNEGRRGRRRECNMCTLIYVYTHTSTHAHTRTHIGRINASGIE